MHFPIMAENAVKGLQGQIPSPSLAFEPLERPHRLNIVLEPRQAMFETERGEKMLSGMAEGRVTDIMTEGDGLDQVLVEVEKTADGAGDSRNQLDVKDPVGDVIVADQAEYLRFIDIAGVGA